MAVRRNRTLLGLVTGGGVLLLSGVLIGTGIGGDEPTGRAAPPTSLRTTPPTTDSELVPLVDDDVERILGTTSGGGPSVVSMSFTAARRWRVDHHVQGRSAAIRLFEPSTGLLIKYRAPVGRSTRYFYRGCTCQVAAGSRGGTFTVTVVDTAE